MRSVQIVLYNESRQTMPSVLGENALISFLFDSFPLFLTGNASFHSNSDKLSYPPPLQPDIKLSTPTIAIERKRSIALSVKQTSSPSPPARYLKTLHTDNLY